MLGEVHPADIVGIQTMMACPAVREEVGPDLFEIATEAECMALAEAENDLGGGGIELWATEAERIEVVGSLAGRVVSERPLRVGSAPSLDALDIVPRIGEEGRWEMMQHDQQL